MVDVGCSPPQATMTTIIEKSRFVSGNPSFMMGDPISFFGEHGLPQLFMFFSPKGPTCSQSDKPNQGFECFYLHDKVEDGNPGLWD